DFLRRTLTQAGRPGSTPQRVRANAHRMAGSGLNPPNAQPVSGPVGVPVLRGRCWSCLISVEPPLIPVVAKQLRRVLRAVRAVAAAHVLGGAIQVAAPAHPLGVGGGLGELLDCHGASPDSVAGLLP